MTPKIRGKKTDHTVEYTISIVSYNKINDLIRCLRSIEKFSLGHSLEVFVVAYFFSEDNLSKLQNEFQWVRIIRSEEVRGFSENHNLVLKSAQGKFCLVLNDDAYFENDVIGILGASFEKFPDAAFFSPLILNFDGTVQDCGRVKFGFTEYVKMRLRLERPNSQRNHRNDIFQTYNISGAAFAVRTNVLKELGYFDERYFFCPEDIALSTTANQRGYKCFVDPTAIVYHRHSMNNITEMYQAIAPALEMGTAIFFGEKRVTRYAVKCFIFLQSILKYVYWFTKSGDERRAFMLPVYANISKTIFSNMTPKELFIEKSRGLYKRGT